MDPEIATAVFAAIMAVGVVAWLYSLSLALRMGNETPQTDWRTFDEPAESSTADLTGARTVHGTPEKLSKALARSLTQLNIGMFASLFEITERTADRLVIKKTGPLMCNQPLGMYFSEAEFKFDQVGHDTTRISYVLGFGRLRRRTKTIALLLILLVGLPVMLAVGLIVWHYVLPSNNPAVRWQVFQTFQIVHALWPPYLMLWIDSAGQRYSKTWLSNLLSTLELAE